ncbi:MAG: large-conductance mechanosensitive channel protein MscL [Bacteroidota bacterium]
MGIVKEFKEFAVRGNVFDMAIGIVIGAAFGKIVTSLVTDVILPPLGILIGGVDFTDLSIILQSASVDALGKPVDAVVLGYGKFIQTLFDFVIVAFAIFLVIKGMNRIKRKQAAEAPPEPTNQEKLLTEIRDLLKSQK